MDGAPCDVRPHRGSWCAARTKSAPDDGACRGAVKLPHAHGPGRTDTSSCSGRPAGKNRGRYLLRRSAQKKKEKRAPKCVYVLCTGFTVSRGGINARACAGASVTGGSDGTSPSGNSSLFKGKIKDLFIWGWGSSSGGESVSDYVRDLERLDGDVAVREGLCPLSSQDWRRSPCALPAFGTRFFFFGHIPHCSWEQRLVKADTASYGANRFKICNQGNNFLEASNSSLFFRRKREREREGEAQE